jgi:hypothetical protein
MKQVTLTEQEQYLVDGPMKLSDARFEDVMWHLGWRSHEIELKKDERNLRANYAKQPDPPYWVRVESEPSITRRWL